MKWNEMKWNEIELKIKRKEKKKEFANEILLYQELKTDNSTPGIYNEKKNKQHVLT